MVSFLFFRHFPPEDALNVEASTYGAFRKEFSNVPSDVSVSCGGNFESSINSIKGRQKRFGGWNPNSPSTTLTKAIYNAVKDELQHRDNVKFKRLRLFLCVNSNLEFKFGVKFFFECDKKQVYIGLSMKRAEVDKDNEKSRAHLVVSKEEYVNNELAKIARKIADILYPESMHFRKAPPYVRAA